MVEIDLETRDRNREDDQGRSSRDRGSAICRRGVVRWIKCIMKRLCYMTWGRGGVDAGRCEYAFMNARPFGPKARPVAA